MWAIKCQDRPAGEGWVSRASGAEASASPDTFDRAELAKQHAVPEDVLAAWFDYLGLSSGPPAISSHLKGKTLKVAGYDFANGWGPGETPNMVANSSDMHVRVPGNLKPRSVAMHPSPTLRVAAGWMSPLSGTLKVRGRVDRLDRNRTSGALRVLDYKFKIGSDVYSQLRKDAMTVFYTQRSGIAIDNKIVLDLMKDKKIAANPAVKRALSLVTPVVTAYGLETDDDHLEVMFRPLPEGLIPAASAVRRHLLSPGLRRVKALLPSFG